VDYKTGQPPSGKAIKAGFAMQLGLLGLLAERDAFGAFSGPVGSFEYWSLAKHQGKLGYVSSPTAGRAALDPSEFVQLAERSLVFAAGRWLTGNAPYTAKLHPEYAPYGEYDQLMRLDEWYGRAEAADSPA